MLIERVFAVGGIFCLALAALLATAFAVYGVLAEDLSLAMPPAVSAVVGVLFLLAGRQARQDRQALLALGTAGEGAAPRDRP